MNGFDQFQSDPNASLSYVPIKLSAYSPSHFFPLLSSDALVCLR